MAPAWIVNGKDATFVSYVNGTNGYTDLGPGVGQVPYSFTITNGTGSLQTAVNNDGTDTVQITTAGVTLTANLSVYALNTNQNIAVTGTPTLTIVSGGLILNSASTLSPNFQFGASGTAEALIYTTTANGTFNGTFITTGGATFFGPGNAYLQNTVNGGLGVYGGETAVTTSTSP